ncbi:hypothetical protein DUT91_25150, partial [Phyllobacterium salinisoli]
MATPTITIVSPSGTNAHNTAALFASAADLDPAKSYIVHWKLGAANTAVTFTANDQDVFSSGG